MIISPAFAALLLLAALLACWPTASAHADAYLGSGTQIKPLDSSKIVGGGATTQSTAADGTFYCSVAYATLAASPSGYAIGDGSSDRASRTSPTA